MKTKPISHVHPAGPGSGGPTGEEARANKAALMSALGKYRGTNERLDEVSNRYRNVKKNMLMKKKPPDRIPRSRIDISRSIRAILTPTVPA
jgi:hypothetical protein